MMKQELIQRTTGSEQASLQPSTAEWQLVASHELMALLAAAMLTCVMPARRPWNATTTCRTVEKSGPRKVDFPKWLNMVSCTEDYVLTLPACVCVYMYK